MPYLMISPPTGRLHTPENNWITDKTAVLDIMLLFGVFDADSLLQSIDTKDFVISVI